MGSNAATGPKPAHRSKEVWIGAVALALIFLQDALPQFAAVGVPVPKAAPAALGVLLVLYMRLFRTREAVSLFGVDASGILDLVDGFRKRRRDPPGSVTRANRPG